MTTLLPRPTEDQEEIALSKALDRLGWFHSHIPNETFTKSRKTKNKNKAMGVSSGIPDHIVIIPGSPGNILVFVELKRSKIKGHYPKGPRPEQLERHKHLRSCGNTVIVGYGATDAINQLLALCQK